MPRRSGLQREKDLAELARRYLQGELQALIAEELNVSQQTISNDLKTLKKRWQDSALIDIDTARQRELAKIDNLEVEYWNAWKRSLGDVETITTEMLGAPKAKSKDDKPRGKVQRRVAGQKGDAAFLKGIQWCIEQRCEILGLKAPNAVENALAGALSQVRIYLPDNNRESTDGD